MTNSIYVGLSGQFAMMQKLDTIARNLAHISTVGYRAENVTFGTTIAQAGSDNVAFSRAGKLTINQESGAIQKTGNPLDIAVKGDSWLAVQTPTGVAYTRDGRLKIDSSGQLVNMKGYPIVDAGQAPIQLPPGGPAPIISSDGSVSQNGQNVGSIGLFTIPTDAILTRGPANTITPDKPAIAQLDFTKNGIAQGYTEGSNVNPIKEVTRLIAVQRAFELISGNIDTVNQAQLDAIRALGPAA